MTLPELIAKLEAATGPSRELDHEIAYTVKWNGHWRGPEAIPPFLASIDAALLLVPDDMWWTAGGCKREQHASVGYEDLDLGDVFEGFGANPAIAVCIAALKAKQGTPT